MSPEKEGTVDTINRGRRKALIISVSDYDDNQLRPLDFCRKDGEQMFGVLKHLGYEVEGRNLVGHVKFDLMRDAIFD